MIPCPHCEGLGRVRLFMGGLGNLPDSLPCRTCMGKGEITPEQVGWIEAGERIYLEQRRRGLSIRRAAAEMGMTAVDYCGVRCGRLNPRLVLRKWGMEATEGPVAGQTGDRG